MTTLKSLFLKYGINSKTNFDIYDICEDLKLECFICMRDEVPLTFGQMRNEIPTSLECNSYEHSSYEYNSYIFNYQTTNEYGSHWCCFSSGSTEGGRTGWYFDSFGIKPIKELESRTLKYNDIQIQPFETEICGILSIYFLYLLKSNKFECVIEKMKKEVCKCIFFKI